MISDEREVVELVHFVLGKRWAGRFQENVPIPVFLDELCAWIVDVSFGQLRCFNKQGVVVHDFFIGRGDDGVFRRRLDDPRGAVDVFEREIVF